MNDYSPLSWHAYEHEHKQNSSDWFWTVGIIAVALASIAVILNDLLFATLIVLIAFTLMLHANKQPRLIKFELMERGIRIDKHVYLYSHLESFWIEEHDGPQAKILIKSHKLLMPLIVIPIEEVNHNEVRDFLADRMDEEEMHEPVSQKILESFGF
ncbi:MAG: hypothetical protein WCW87_00820 [Candidatus Paceibacterota bacterium]